MSAIAEELGDLPLAQSLDPALQYDWGPMTGWQLSPGANPPRAGNIVCGDAYIIQGQSNAVAYDFGKEDPAFRSDWRDLRLRLSVNGEERQNASTADLIFDIPTLIDEGLAIGGAASAVGIDFPYPNFTGPATALGLILSATWRVESQPSLGRKTDRAIVCPPMPTFVNASLINGDTRWE